MVLGPAIGEDACAIELPAGTLVAATDPITLTGSEVGALAVAINANDVAVMGVRPRWFLAAVLLPAGSVEDDVRALFASMRRALTSLGVALVGGHTEVTATVAQPLVVGQMLGFAEDGRIVPTSGAQPGDALIQIGPAPVEGAAVLAQECADRMGDVDADLLARARIAAEDPGVSVVEAALHAARLGATALHDPTEGGLAAGLHELADASGVALRVDAAAVLWFEPGLAVCRAVGANPWSTLASGCVLAAFSEARAEAALSDLRTAGFRAEHIAHAEAGSGVHRTDDQHLPLPDRDEVARILETR